MNSEKLEDLLNLALDAGEEEREKSLNLNVGYDRESQEWELILRYDQEAAKGRRELEGLVPLSFGYGIIRVPQSQIETLAALPEIEYIEKPKKLFFAVNRGKTASCFSGLPPAKEAEGGGSSLGTPAGEPEPSGTAEERASRRSAGELPLDGSGVIAAVIDSGVDYFHPDFRNKDGTTRILALWDQTVSQGPPPEGFRQGTEFLKARIDQALAAGSREAGYNLVPSRDISGHGTQVLGILAGNGNASGGLFTGGAPESPILAVKMGTPGERDFPSTTQLMQAVEYVVRKASEYEMPVAVNLSFGNAYGSHTGTSLVETYLNAMAGKWKTVIVAGAGNEGAGRGHASGRLTEAEGMRVELAVSEFEPVLNVQLWKQYGDEFDVTVIHPGGERVTLPPLSAVALEQGGAGTQRYRLGATELLIYYGVPAPYSGSQEIYLDFLPMGTYVDSGIWRMELAPRKIIGGEFDLWLPGTGVLNPDTGFLRPSPEATLTIPSTAEKVITVGAYDPDTMAYAPFSGRGYTRYPVKIKPELAAPGVAITAAAVGGGYASATGTSFAAPFVTAAAVLLMQWGECVIRLSG